jgi:hypothetical protein
MIPKVSMAAKVSLLAFGVILIPIIEGSIVREIFGDIVPLYVFLLAMLPPMALLVYGLSGKL